MQGNSSKTQQHKRCKAKRTQAQQRHTAKIKRYANSKKTWQQAVANTAQQKLSFANTPHPRTPRKVKLSTPYKQLQQVLLGYTQQVYSIGTQRYNTVQCTCIAYVLHTHPNTQIAQCYIAPSKTHTNNSTGYIIGVYVGAPYTGAPHTTNQFWFIQYVN